MEPFIWIFNKLEEAKGFGESISNVFTEKENCRSRSCHKKHADIYQILCAGFWIILCCLGNFIIPIIVISMPFFIDGVFHGSQGNSKFP